MPELREQVVVAAPVEQVYRVVADVDAYPRFLPGVRAVRRQGDLVEMTVQVGPLELTWTHRAEFEENRAIRLRLVQGPFRRLDGCWTFTPTPEGTLATYHTIWELDLPIPGARLAVSQALKANLQRTIRAFAERIQAQAAGGPSLQA